MADIDEMLLSAELFVPIENQHALQVINEDKEFNNEIMNYIHKVAPSLVGDNYHIISVFGSQLTGKSTLLNKLFHTSFDTMDDSQGRNQTTHGIWMAYSPVVNTTHPVAKGSLNLFVMDVEGTDGRERGEDQDFERKAALFALATLEIMIVNIWEHQVGLYQGANMGLLKTVFEVNLTLFGAAKARASTGEEQEDSAATHKILLLFVIRDHVGNTPLLSLADSLTSDLHKMWDSLNKPQELAHLKFEDFFDVDFHAIHHKILQPEEFAQDVSKLGDRLTGPKLLFKPEYHHDVPIDGWTMYAELCWQQIETNKDLDLPTQQILVAKFKCDEIAQAAYANFEEKFDDILKTQLPQEGVDTDYENLAIYMAELRDEVLEEYDEDARRYNPSVYEDRRNQLTSKVYAKLQHLFDAHMQVVLNNVLTAFAALVKLLKGKNFEQEVGRLTSELLAAFAVVATPLALGGALQVTALRKELAERAEEIVKKQQLIELVSLVNKGVKKVGAAVAKIIEAELLEAHQSDENDAASVASAGTNGGSTPTKTTNAWDAILAEFNKQKEQFLSKYLVKDGEYDFRLATTSQQNKEAVARFTFKAWDSFYSTIHRLITKESVLATLKDRFELQFRYDVNGKPRLYQNTTQLEHAFDDAKEYALELMPLVTTATTSKGEPITPEVDIFDRLLRASILGDDTATEDDSDSDDEATTFSAILDPKLSQQVLAKFKRETDAQFIETKRLIIQHITQIPYYIYLVILVLGWNEFMAVLRNPLLFSLLLIIGAGVYALYTMNMLNPAISVAQRLSDEAVTIAKEKLREVLVDDHATLGRQLGKVAGTEGKRNRPEVVVPEEVTEEIEMQDL